MSNHNNIPLNPDHHSHDSFAWSCPQTEMERLKAQYNKEKSSYTNHVSSNSSTGMNGVHHNQFLRQHQHQHRGQSFTHNSSLSSMDSSFTDMSLDKFSPSSSSRVIQLPVCNSNSFTDDEFTLHEGAISCGSDIIHMKTDKGVRDTSRLQPGFHKSLSNRTFRSDTFARSCPQTEMERLKARYLKEETSYVSQSSTLSSTDVSSHDLSNVELKRSQNYHSVDSDEDEDVYLYFDTLSDASLDKLSPSSSAKVFQAYTPSCDDRDSAHLKPGLHHNSPSVGTYHSGSLKDVLYSVVSCSPSSCDMNSFARSCPQTEMERLKAEYLNEKSPYLKQKPSHSSTGRSHLQHQHQQQQQQQQQQHIRCYNSEEDDDVLLLNFNSPLTDAALDKLSSSSNSRVIQPPVRNINADLKSGLHHHTPSGAHRPEAFARSCPQTEMERLKAHYMKEKMSNMTFDKMMHGSRQGSDSHLYSAYNSFNSIPNFSERSSLSSLDGRHRIGDGQHSMSYRSNFTKTAPNRGDYFASDQKFNSRKNVSQQSKENNKTNNSRDYKDLSNDLGVFSIDSKCAFSADALPCQREAVFHCVRQCKAQIILMSNTGLGTEDQLQLVRAEVKTFFLSCESAMWASFSDGSKTENSGVDDGSLQQPSEGQVVSAGRGVIILVLGPLAPRTGWIKSDAKGCVISASARIKPNLPVLTFVACDFGGIISHSKQFDNPSLVFLYDLAHAEYAKDNVVIMGGNLSGDAAKSSLTNSDNLNLTKQICDWIQSSGVNISAVCDSSSQGGCGSVPEDVLVCQKKKAMSIVGVELSQNIFIGENLYTSPCLVKVNISGWPKKSFAIQPKTKLSPKAEKTGIKQTAKWSVKVDSSQLLLSRQKLINDLLGWQQHLQDFAHNLQGILHTNIDKVVQCNCLKQLLTDILNQAQADITRIDTPGFANTQCLNRLSALLSLPEKEFLVNALAIEQIIASWCTAVSIALKPMMEEV